MGLLTKPVSEKGASAIKYTVCTPVTVYPNGKAYAGKPWIIYKGKEVNKPKEKPQLDLEKGEEEVIIL